MLSARKFKKLATMAPIRRPAVRDTIRVAAEGTFDATVFGLLLLVAVIAAASILGRLSSLSHLFFSTFRQNHL